MFSSIIFNLQLWPSSVTPLFHLKLKTPFYKSFPPLSANSLQAAFLELHTGLDRTCSTIFVLILTRVTIFSFGSCTRLSCWQASIRVHVNHHHPFCNITLAYLCYNFSACQLIFQLACRSLSPIKYTGTLTVDEWAVTLHLKCPCSVFNAKCHYNLYFFNNNNLVRWWLLAVWYTGRWWVGCYIW